MDYSLLGADVADEMSERARRICNIQRASVLDVGRELLAAKELVDHGWFRGWIESACQMHIRTAERLMQAALLVQKNDNLSYCRLTGFWPSPPDLLQRRWLPQRRAASANFLV